MTGHYIAEQVAAFFAERGLLPVVTVGGAAKVHAAYPDAPLVSLCSKPFSIAARRGVGVRPARGRDLRLPPCRRCTKAHISDVLFAWHRRAAVAVTGSARTDGTADSPVRAPVAPVRAARPVALAGRALDVGGITPGPVPPGVVPRAPGLETEHASPVRCALPPQGGRPGCPNPHTQNAPAIAGDSAAGASEDT